jgi:hypothetical protein
MPAGPPQGNKNAEKWTLEKAQELFDNAIILAREGKKVKRGGEIVLETYDFVGEVARELHVYRDLFNLLAKKYPDELKDRYKNLLSYLEANCFTHGKSGDIVPSLAIMNLKSNYGWTDRVDNTSGGEPIKSVTINLGDGENPEKEKE